MPLIEWNTQYSVGIETMDKQHQKLIGIINSLYEEITKGSGRDAVGGAIKQLKEYGSYHFQEEEKFMKLFGFPNLDKHKTLHVEYIDSINDFEEKFTLSNSSMTLEVMNFLKDWLTKHIMNMDKKYGKFILNKAQKIKQAKESSNIPTNNKP